MDCIQIPANVKNLTGQRFGRLEVIAYAGSDKQRRAKWVCRCAGPQCAGKQVTVAGAKLRSGDTTSCGCRKRETLAENSAKSGPTKHGLSSHPLYNVWYQMVARCTNPRDKGYADYGGRGITVCDAWLRSVEAFCRDMSPGYAPGLQMDRRDNDGPYSLANCQWVTPTQNNRNRRTSRVIEFAGQRRCLAEWAELLGLHRGTIGTRLRSGWTVERALTEGAAPEMLAELGVTE